MNDFISTIRTDRKREIKKRENEGIIIPDKYRYRIVDTISVLKDGKEYIFGVQANQKDVYFFIIDEGANSYFTIVEIYELLKYVVDSGNEDVVYEALEKIYTTEMKKVSQEQEDRDVEIWENRGRFNYRGISYYIKDVEYPDYAGEIQMLDGSGTMSYLQLFMLINLIQEKSNAFFSRGGANNCELINGIVRLFDCLLRGTSDHESLMRLGWFWDNIEKKYVLNADKAEKKERKYYLTKAEFEDIIYSES